MQLDPVKSGIIRISLGQALIASGDPASLKKAVTEISDALERDRENSAGYRYLAQAYGQLGEIPQAELATAEAIIIRARIRTPRSSRCARRAKMKRGEPGWVRAQDIINYKIPKKKS